MLHANVAGARTIVLLALIATAGCQTLEAVPAASVPKKFSGAGSYLMGRHAVVARDTDRAAENFRAALILDSNNTTLLEQSFQSEIQHGDIAAAMIVLKRAEKAGAVVPFMHLAQAIGHAKEDDWLRAQIRLAQLPKSRINQILGPLLQGWAAAGLKDWAASRAAFEKVEALPGFDYLALLHSGNAARLEGDLKRADRAFEEVMEFTPTARIVLAAWQNFMANGRLDRAQRILAKYPGHKFVAPKTADPLSDSAILSAGDGVSEALCDVAQLLFVRNDETTALIMTQLALYIRPSFAPGKILIGELLDQRGQPAAALEIYRGIAENSAYHKTAQMHIAYGLRALDRVEEAVQHLRDFATTRPEDPAPWKTIGDIERSRKSWLAAVAAYDAAIERIEDGSPRDWDLFYSRGIAFERGKQWERAEADFRRALELSPDQPYVMNYLGYSWTEQGVNLDKAEALIEQAAALRPNDGFIVDSLGWILYRTGRFEEAVKKLEQAVRMQPSDATINDHLGDAYWHVGRHHEAKFQWQRALGLEPEADLATAIGQKLKDGLEPLQIPTKSDDKVSADHKPDS